jgi:peptide deformylase
MTAELKPLPSCSKPEMRLVIWPDESLKHAVAPFPEDNISSRLVRETAGAMIRSMYKHYGVGLAAQQVGVPFRIFVMDSQWTNGEKKMPRIFLNPTVTGTGEGAQELTHPGEGCLSFPYNYRSPVARLDRLELEWVDFKGETHHQWFEGMEAIIIQHEMDHLNGFCFIDHLSPLKKDRAIRKARKTRRRYRKGYKRALSELKNATSSKEYLLKRQQAFEAGVRSGGVNA